MREVFWAAMRGGADVTQAAVAAGVSEIAGAAWVKQAGYVPRTAAPARALGAVDRSPRQRAPLSFLERCRLEDLLETGCTAVRAAELLARHHSTVRREIAKGLTSSGYRARVGQDVAEVNRRRPKVRKLEGDPVVLAEVLKGLRSRHSPEQIAGRLRVDFPEDPEMWVSHETIYQALYVQPRGELARLVRTRCEPGALAERRRAATPPV
uniref:helix-turn-helix domain-containing protein n=1 Tax=Mycolicibacterium madagascariense TaxID=212765 RepID=UPI001FE3B586|nr:helix-turn-helix domain-containing protein [Mycolicibacterium madagascariense]